MIQWYINICIICLCQKIYLYNYKMDYESIQEQQSTHSDPKVIFTLIGKYTFHVIL